MELDARPDKICMSDRRNKPHPYNVVIASLALLMTRLGFNWPPVNKPESIDCHLSYLSLVLSLSIPEIYPNVIYPDRARAQDVGAAAFE